MEDHEVSLIAQAVEGDAEAFGLLYDAYHPQIYRFIYLKTGRREDAEDLTHHVFLHAWEHIRGYVDRGHPFSSWLYRMARNAVIDHYRVRRSPVRLDDLDTEALAAPEVLEAAMDTALAFRELRETLRELKPEHQDIIILRFVEELSLKESARVLGKSEGAVKLLQHRAVNALRKKFEPGAAELKTRHSHG